MYNNKRKNEEFAEKINLLSCFRNQLQQNSRLARKNYIISDLLIKIENLIEDFYEEKRKTFLISYDE